VTTIAFSRKHRQVAADSWNTDSAGAKFTVDKIDVLPDSRVFLGSGHLLPIGKVRQWSLGGLQDLDRPEFGELFCDDRANFTFSCLVISADGTTAMLIDDEMQPQQVFDDFLAIGSGAAYAIGAMEQGATPAEAVFIASRHDGNTGGPIKTYTFPAGDA